MRFTERAMWCGLGIVVGLFSSAFWKAEPARAADGEPHPPVLVDEKDLRLVYANAFRVHTTDQEAVIDFGFNMINPSPQKGAENQVLIKMADRVVLTHLTAKRLAASLNETVKQLGK